MTIFGGIFRGTSNGEGGGSGISDEFYATLSGDAEIAFGPVPVTIIPDTEIYDDTGAYNSETGEYTIPATGKYQFEAQIRMQPEEAAAAQIIIAKAPYGLGELLMVSTQPLPNDPGNVYLVKLASPPIELVSGDIVKMFATWAGSANADIYSALGGTYFAGRRVK